MFVRPKIARDDCAFQIERLARSPGATREVRFRGVRPSGPRPRAIPMKLRVSLRPTEALGQEKGEVATACVDCGNGEQILRWLAFAACDRVAHLANLPAGTFVPQAVINREGIVEDVDAMIRARYADGDGVVVRFSRGPEAFTVRWEGRPTTPPASETPAAKVTDDGPANGERSRELPQTDEEAPHHAAGVAWLEKRLDFDAFGIGALLGDSGASSSRANARAEELAAARAALLAHAGGLQALFKLYESDGDVEMRDVDKMNLEQFRRFMVDAKAIEFGPQTITAADVDACFNEALKRKGGEKEQKGVAKTLDAIAFLVAVFRVAAKKYDLAVIKAPDVGFAELHRRLDHFVEAHVHEFLCGAFEEMHENLARAFADEDARAEMQKAQRLIAQTTKMCMPRRPPGAEWSVYVHDLTKNATEWGVLGDDADATSPDASKTLGRATSKSGSVKAEDAARTSAESTSVEGEGVVASGDAALAEAFDPDAPVRVDLHAYAQAVIDATQNVGDFKLFKPEEAPARLTAAQFEKLLLALAWLQYGKRVARAKRAEEAAEAARAEAEARRRRELAAEEDAPNDASLSDSEKDDVPGGAAEEFVGDAARGDASPPSTTTASPADSKYATPSFAEHLREFLVDIFYKTGVLAELSEDEHDSEPDSEGDPDDWSDEEEETA